MHAGFFAAGLANGGAGLAPRNSFRTRAAGVDVFHRARWRWADEVAEIAADAFLFDDVWVMNSVDVLPVEALMCAVVYDVHQPLAVRRGWQDESSCR